MQTNSKHKDRLFRFIFGNPEHKEWTLSLYNAINGSNYTNPEDIEFNTIDDIIYMGMKNDVSNEERCFISDNACHESLGTSVLIKPEYADTFFPSCRAVVRQIHEG